MTNLLEKIRQLFQQSKESQKQDMTASVQPSTPQTDGDIANHDVATLNAEIVKHLMEILEHTHEGMYTCEETYDLLDEYVELIADNEEAAKLMPYVKKHLDKCPDCNNVYATLLNIIQSEPPA